MLLNVAWVVWVLSKAVHHYHPDLANFGLRLKGNCNGTLRWSLEILERSKKLAVELDLDSHWDC
jgi:hypothetical protein